MKNKILIVTPKFPFPPSGACEQDRFCGIKQFLEQGFEVRVIAKVSRGAKMRVVQDVAKKMGITVFTVSYKFFSLSLLGKIKNYLARFLKPIYLDGSTFEYTEKEIVKIFKNQIDDFKPDYVYFDYTFLWPLYKIAKKRNIPIITRSINFEANHFLEENGYNFINYIRFFPKLLSEYIVSKKSDLLFSISPKEEKIYKRMGAKNVVNLPLRGLSVLFGSDYEVKDKEVLDVVFSGSTYNVRHNREALEFVLKDVAPSVLLRFPGKFKFHITGGKFPEDLKKYLNENVVYEGYVENLNSFFCGMDISLSPSLSGCGMQQKIFEPMVIGLPTITHQRGLADYPFLSNQEVALAETGEDFVSALGKMSDYDFRKKLSAASKKKSATLFSKEVIDDIVFLNTKLL